MKQITNEQRYQIEAYLKAKMPIKFIANKDNLIFESERILAGLEKNPIETKFANELSDIKHLTGKSKTREVKTRVNQYVFRQIVIANYSGKCAISGIDIPGLLVASHIIPWSKNKNERLNPENGICLSSLYDKAFDIGLIGLNTDYKILISSDLKKNINKEYYTQYFGFLNNHQFNLPAKYHPKKEFIEFHLDTIFRK